MRCSPKRREQSGWQHLVLRRSVCFPLRLCIFLPLLLSSSSSTWWVRMLSFVSRTDRKKRQAAHVSYQFSRYSRLGDDDENSQTIWKTEANTHTTLHTHTRLTGVDSHPITRRREAEEEEEENGRRLQSSRWCWKKISSSFFWIQQQMTRTVSKTDAHQTIEFLCFSFIFFIAYFIP